MSKFEIERGVGAPKAPTNRKYPFEELKVGDALHFKNKKLYNTLRSQAARRGKKLGFTFRVAKESDGIRVYRTA